VGGCGGRENCRVALSFKCTWSADSSSNNIFVRATENLWKYNIFRLGQFQLVYIHTHAQTHTHTNNNGIANTYRRRTDKKSSTGTWLLFVLLLLLPLQFLLSSHTVEHSCGEESHTHTYALNHCFWFAYELTVFFQRSVVLFSLLIRSLLSSCAYLDFCFDAPFACTGESSLVWVCI